MTSLLDEKRATRALSRPLSLPNYVTEARRVRQAPLPGDGRREYLFGVTIRVNEWYRVKSTGQYCRVQRIPSTRTPGVSVAKADENTRGFELALEWYAPSDPALRTWTKRVMIMELRKAVTLLRDPVEADRPLIRRLQSIAAGLPITSAGRDGEFTLPV